MLWRLPYPVIASAACGGDVAPFRPSSRLTGPLVLGLLVQGLLGAVAGGLPGALAAQMEISARDAPVRFGGRLHSQFATSSAAGGKSADFFTRRARFTIDVRVSPLLDARIQPDFGGGKLDLKDAYFRLSFDRALRLSMGQFKRAFDVFELNSSTEMVVVERTGRIDGVDECAGPGGVCSLSRFTEKLGYSDRDVGVKADGSIGGRVGYMVTLTNGTGGSGPDENSGKSLAARLSLRLASSVELSGNVSRRDYVDVDGGTAAATAYGGDLKIGGFRDGSHLQVGVVRGANWRHPSSSGQMARFLAWQAVASRYFPLEDSPLAAIEPMVRLGGGDPDLDANLDAGLIVTPGLFVYVKSRNRIGANLDVYDSGSGARSHSFKLQTYLYY